MKRFLIALLACSSMLAQAWEPKKPITVIFPNGPGAGNEIAFRIIAKIVEEKNPSFKWVADYRPGADGNIAMSHFNTLPADGYSVATPSCQSTFVTAEIWYPQTVKFDAMAWEGVINLGKSPLAFYAMTSSTVNTPQELIAEVRAKKRPINFAVGGAAHKLAVEYFTAGVNQGINQNKDTVETALYKGPAQAAQDVVANQVEFGVFPIAVGHPFVESGKIKLIGLASEFKMPGLEKAPLMKDYVPGLNVYACWNLMLPRGTPADVQKWYHDAFVEAIQTVEVREQYTKNYIFTSPAEFTSEGIRESMRRLRQQWQPFAVKIKPD